MRIVRSNSIHQMAGWLAVLATGQVFSQGFEGPRRPPKPNDAAQANVRAGYVQPPPESALLPQPQPLAVAAPESLVRFSVPEMSPIDRAPNLISGFHNSPLKLFHEVKSGNDFQIVQRGNITDIPTPSGRGMLVSENNSAVPRDRVYMFYNHFAGVFNSSAYSTGLADFRAKNFDVDRWTFGFEKSFPEKNWSVEVRVPMASTLDPSMALDVNDKAGNVDFALGNVSIILKQVLYQSERSIISAGLGIETPTSGPTRVTLTDFGTVFQGGNGLLVEDLIRIQSLEFKNNTVNLEPFLSALYTPDDNWFFQGFLQFHIPTDRNHVTYIERADDLQFLQPDTNSNFGPFRLDRGVRDQAMAHLNIGMGYWLQNGGGRLFSGVAPTVELSYSQTLEAAQQPILVPDPFPLLRQNSDGTSAGVTEEPVRFGNFNNYQSILSVTLGATFVTNDGSTLAVGFGLPLMSKADKVEDFQVQIQYNRRFGRGHALEPAGMPITPTVTEAPTPRM